ncbi:MAG: FAD-binding oxidoreductase, partial [Pyrinomonadaceae bacterium]
MLIKSDIDELIPYLTDASNMPGGHAEKLFVPENEAEIAEILRDANARRIPVTVSGARTGTVGGAVPFGGWVISLEKLNKIKSIDKENFRAVVEPGVILGDFQKALEAEGLFYPPDPTEWSCQIGGTVATNASGARSFKYGATREFVKGLRVVMANGEVRHLKRGEALDAGVTVPTYQRPNVRKNVSGFFNEQPLDAIDLFIGSEGTLGVITEIELEVLPKAEGFFSGIVFFSRAADLLSFVGEARSSSF